MSGQVVFIASAVTLIFAFTAVMIWSLRKRLRILRQLQQLLEDAQRKTGEEANGKAGAVAQYTAVSFAEKFAKFSDQFAPKVIAQMNDYQFKLARVEGEFVWHSHAETDETFIVVEGEMNIDFRDGTVLLRPGEMFVVPRGKEHKPRAAVECKIMLVEPVGTVNTGNAGGHLTAPNDAWI